MAIKGKAKRSQGRPVRRPGGAHRAPVLKAKPQKWYAAPAFAVTLAVVVLLTTAIVAGLRMQAGFRHDDLRRYTASLEAPMRQLQAIAGTGFGSQPGMATAGDLAAGKVKPADFAKRAAAWTTQLGQVREAVSGLSLGTPSAAAQKPGVPSNPLGGHVGLLASVNEAYQNGVGDYVQAAGLWALAAQVKEKADQTKLAQQAQSQQAQAEQAVNTAAALLARLRAGNGLAVTGQMPGESAQGFSVRNPSPSSPTLPGG